jgi:hypothetical protein
VDSDPFTSVPIEEVAAGSDHIVSIVRVPPTPEMSRADREPKVPAAKRVTFARSCAVELTRLQEVCASSTHTSADPTATTRPPQVGRGSEEGSSMTSGLRVYTRMEPDSKTVPDCLRKRDRSLVKTSRSSSPSLPRLSTRGGLKEDPKEQASTEAQAELASPIGLSDPESPPKLRSVVVWPPLAKRQPFRKEPFSHHSYRSTRGSPRRELFQTRGSYSGSLSSASSTRAPASPRSRERKEAQMQKDTAQERPAQPISSGLPPTPSGGTPPPTETHSGRAEVALATSVPTTENPSPVTSFPEQTLSGTPPPQAEVPSGLEERTTEELQRTMARGVSPLPGEDISPQPEPFDFGEGTCFTALRSRQLPDSPTEAPPPPPGSPPHHRIRSEWELLPLQECTAPQRERRPPRPLCRSRVPPHIAFMARGSNSEVSDPRARTSTKGEEEGVC